MNDRIKAAIVMAGGKSSRMRKGGDATHKALRTVCGKTLLEHNVQVLLNGGFHKIYIAISHSESLLDQFLARQIQPLVDRYSASLLVYRETEPEGTIGATRMVSEPDGDLLVINVDNLTTLNLNAFVRHHAAVSACMTIATHLETFQMPFGEVVVQEGEIIALREKPETQFHTSSGTYVLSPQARQLIPEARALGAPELYGMIRDQGFKVAAYEHESDWIDINNPQALERAERIVQSNPETFQASSPYQTLRGQA